MKMKIKQSLATLSVVLLTVSGTSFTANGQDEPWRFGVSVPLWAVGIDGDVTVDGVEQDVDIGFDDLKDKLDASFSLGLEARKGKLGFYTGLGYMEFSEDGFDADGELKFVIAEAGVSYLLVKTESEHPFLLEGTLGIRYWRTETDLEIKDSSGTVLFEGGQDRDLVDPVIGLRGSQYLSSKLHLDFAGDIGGFGISDDTSDLDWSALGLVSYDFTKWFTLSAGYKAVGLDVSRDGGADENGLDLVFNGALMVAKFRF